MERLLGVLTLSLLALGPGCSSGGSSSHGVSVSYGVQQQHLEGTWSGTLTTDDGAVSTLVVHFDRFGFILYGHASDGSLIVAGDLPLETSVGDVSIGLLTSLGLELFGEGFVSGDCETIQLVVVTDLGVVGDLVLQRTSGPDTFFVSDLAGLFEIELVEPYFAGVRVGDVTLGSDGFVVGGFLDGLEIVDGTLWIDDSALGLFALDLHLENGELVIIDGVVSLADLTLSGRYADDFVSGGTATLRPW